MKEQIRISAKNLGELKLPNFCPRCFWIKLHSKNLPYQIFPGIFSSIDSYSKKITNLHFEQHDKIPRWFDGFGSLGRPVKVPHHSNFFAIDPDNNIKLTGAPDEMFQKSDKSYFIIDYKTAKFTGAQDSLLPLYEVQLNSYAYIAERTGLYPVSGLGLVYYEPLTDISAADITSYTYENGFSMYFTGKLLSVNLNTDNIKPLLAKVREIYEQDKPPREGECKDCESLEALISMIIK